MALYGQRALYTVSEVSVFDRAKQTELAHFLNEQDKHTVLASLDTPDQVLLTAECKTQRGGFQLSDIAFRSICRAACPGLSNVVADLAGLRRFDQDADRDRFSTADSIQVMNLVVKRRFRTQLEGMQVVRDTRKGLIEGVVGRNYQRLSNFMLFTRAEETLKHCRQPFIFHRAWVFGRYMTLAYRHEEPLFTVPGPRGREGDSYYPGVYYSNSEVGSRAVRAAPMILRNLSDQKAIGFFGRSGKLTHVGRNFDRRLEHMLVSAAERRPEVDKLKASVERMVSTRLGFTGQADPDEKLFQDLMRVLTGKDIVSSLARRIVRGVVLQSGFDASAVSNIRYVSKEAWVDRTVYDFFVSLMRVASGLPIITQEQVEQIAYALLVGKLNL